MLLFKGGVLIYAEHCMSKHYDIWHFNWQPCQHKPQNPCCVYVCVCVSIYIYTCICMYVYVYIYVCRDRPIYRFTDIFPDI